MHKGRYFYFDITDFNGNEVVDIILNATTGADNSKPRNLHSLHSSLVL